MVQQKFFNLEKYQNSLIIIYKGVQKNNRHEKCPFLHDENWGDIELVEHEESHKLLISKNYSWLGFDVPHSFGTFSGRDGKRT